MLCSREPSFLKNNLRKAASLQSGMRNKVSFLKKIIAHHTCHKCSNKYFLYSCSVCLYLFVHPFSLSATYYTHSCWRSSASLCMYVYIFYLIAFFFFFLQDSQQPSPLALLAATCSRIDTPGESDSPSDQQQQLDLNQGTFTSSANGWQVVPLSVQASSGTSTITTDSSGAMAGGDAGKARQVLSPTVAVGSAQGQQYVVAQAPSMPGQQVLTAISGVMPNIQYQVIPQFQTVDGQPLQLTHAQQDSAVSAAAASGQQFQIVSSPNGQQIIAATNRAGPAGNIITMPSLLQGAIPIQNISLGNGVLQNQPQFLANMPVSLNGNITLLPLSTGASSTGGDGSTGGDTGGNQAIQQQQAQRAVSSTSGAGYATGVSTVTTQTSASYGVTQTQNSNGGMAGTFQQNVPIHADSREGQQPQQILLQPQVIQGSAPLQSIQAGTVSTAGGQVFTAPTLSQEGLQNLQIMPNAGPILIRTVGPNGQVSWQTIQIQNPAGPQITLAPVQSLPQGGTAGAGVSVNTVQIPGIQTINLNSLGGSGLQMHQLQTVPITLAGAGQSILFYVFGLFCLGFFGCKGKFYKYNEPQHIETTLLKYTHIRTMQCCVPE